MLSQDHQIKKVPLLLTEDELANMLLSTYKEGKLVGFSFSSFIEVINSKADQGILPYLYKFTSLSTDGSVVPEYKLLVLKNLITIAMAIRRTFNQYAEMEDIAILPSHVINHYKNLLVHDLEAMEYLKTEEPTFKRLPLDADGDPDHNGYVDNYVNITIAMLKTLGIKHTALFFYFLFTIHKV